MSRTIKLWTGMEILNLKKWRDERLPVKVIAKRLGRSERSVRKKCHHIGDVREHHHKPGEMVERIKGYRALGYDGYIAVDNGISKRTVRYHRNRHRIPAKKPPRWSQKRNQSKRWRCFNCNVLCPIASHKGWSQKVDWVVNIICACGINTQIALCPECKIEGNQENFSRIHIPNPDQEDRNTETKSYPKVIVDATVLMLHRLGLGDVDIADIAGLSKYSILDIRKRLGLVNNYPARHLNRQAKANLESK